MNTTSEHGGKSPLPRKAALRGRSPKRQRTPKRRLAALIAALTLGACIQGPWDYYPENPPVFLGVFVSGYAVAKRPIQRMCFERVLHLTEEATEAYPFYDSADVRVTGSFSGEVKTLQLTAIVDTPNCFIGDTAALVDSASSYDLRARFVWDSSGTTVTSVITGTAHVPAFLKMHDSAAAPSLAAQGGVPDSLFVPGPDAVPRLLAFLDSLPIHVRPFGRVYRDTLVKLQGDTAKSNAFIREHGKEAQGALIELLKRDKFKYAKGATVYYLNGAFNTLSHYFSCDRSGDVKAVLITQRFDPTGERPETAFDRPLGLEPESAQYYFPGYHRRLLLYPDAKSRNGWNLLDSMGVVNTWFHTKVNRFYFYGTEQAYLNFNQTATLEPNPRVKVKYNVEGGIGFFAGAVVDSFDVNVVTDDFTKKYPLPVVHALSCNDRGWSHNEDCRDYYPVYCKDSAWAKPECRVDAVRACLVYQSADSASRDTSLAVACARAADTAVSGAERLIGGLQFCIENDFTAARPECAPAAAQCAQGGDNACKDALWTYCKDNLWRPAQCQPALVTYCKDKGRPSEALCSQADAFCRANPGETACK